MLKTFQIDFVRRVFENALSKNNGETYYDDQDIQLFSFYEHLSENDEVERYTQRYNDLVNEQNKSGLIGFGLITNTDVPSVTNIKKGFISPFEWSCTIRVNLANRDTMLGTIYKLIADLKGKKVDVAQLDSGKLVVVGTMVDSIKDYDFIGEVSDTEHETIIEKLQGLISKGISYNYQNVKCFYVECENKLRLIENKNGYYVDISDEEIDFNEDNIVDYTRHNVPTHKSFEKFKIDFSFDDIKVNEPYTLNAMDYCNISFGGSATLVNDCFRLGNDLVKVLVAKNKVKTSDSTDFSFKVDNELVFTELEPLEMPSGNNSNSIPNQLKSNFFRVNSHTDSYAIALQYSFILDSEIELIKQWFNYGRYGESNLTSNGSIQLSSITPNILYTIKEVWASWGNVEIHEFNAKIIEDINIENTESDTMTISLTFQIQGDNE